jgi:hypothetical protein
LTTSAKEAFNDYTDLNTTIRGIALDSVSSTVTGGAEQREKFALYGRRAQELSKSIRIIGETATTDYEYSYVSLIEGADKIIFLGFGYDDRNLQVLRLKQRVNTLLSRSYASDWELPVIGSAYGMGKAQIRDAEAAIHSNILLGDKHLSCVPFCNEYVSTVIA